MVRSSSQRHRKTPKMPPLPVLREKQVVPGLSNDTLVPEDDLLLQMVRAMAKMTADYQKVSEKLKQQSGPAPPAPPTPPRPARPTPSAPAFATAPIPKQTAVLQTAIASRTLTEATDKIQAAQTRADKIKRMQNSTMAKLNTLESEYRLAPTPDKPDIMNAMTAEVEKGKSLIQQLSAASEMITKNKLLKETAESALQTAQAVLSSEEMTNATEMAKNLSQATVDYVKKEGFVGALKRVGASLANVAEKGAAKVSELLAEASTPEPRKLEGSEAFFLPSAASKDIIPMPPDTSAESLRQRMVYVHTQLPKDCALLSDARVCADTGVCQIEDGKCVPQSDTELYKQGVPTTQQQLTAEVLKLRRKQLDMYRNRKQICNVSSEEQCTPFPEAPCVWKEAEQKCKYLGKDLLPSDWPTTPAELQTMEEEYRRAAIAAEPVVAAPVAPIKPILQEFQQAKHDVATAQKVLDRVPNDKDALTQLANAQQEVLDAAVKIQPVAPVARVAPVAVAAAAPKSDVPVPAAVGEQEVQESAEDLSFLQELAKLDHDMSSEKKEELTKLTSYMSELLTKFSTIRHDFSKPLAELEAELAAAVPGSDEQTKLRKYVEKRKALEADRQRIIRESAEEIADKQTELIEYSTDAKEIETALADIDAQIATAASSPNVDADAYEKLLAQQTRLQQALAARADEEVKQTKFKGDVSMLKEQFDLSTQCITERGSLEDAKTAEHAKHESQRQALEKRAEEATAEFKECNKLCESAAEAKATAEAKAVAEAKAKKSWLGRTQEPVIDEQTQNDIKTLQQQCDVITRAGKCNTLNDAREMAQQKVSRQQAECKAVDASMASQIAQKNKECKQYQAQSNKYVELFARELKANDIRNRIATLTFQKYQAETDVNYGVETEFVKWCEILANASREVKKGKRTKQNYDSLVATSFVSPAVAVHFVNVKNEMLIVIEIIQGLILEAQGKDIMAEEEDVAEQAEEDEEDANDPNRASADDLFTTTVARANKLEQAVEPPPPAPAAASAPSKSVEDLLQLRRDAQQRIMNEPERTRGQEQLKFDRDILQNLNSNPQTCNVFNYSDPRKTMVECLARDPYCELSLSNTCVPVDAAKLNAIGVPKSLSEYKEMLQDKSAYRYTMVDARAKHNTEMNPRVEAAAVAYQGVIGTVQAKLVEKMPDFVKKFISYAGAAVRYSAKEAKKYLPTAWSALKTAATHGDVALSRLLPNHWVFAKQILTAAGVASIAPVLVSILPWGLGHKPMQYLYNCIMPGKLQWVFNQLTDPLTKEVYIKETGTYASVANTSLGYLPYLISTPINVVAKAIISPVGGAALMSLIAVGLIANSYRKVTASEKPRVAAKQEANPAVQTASVRTPRRTGPAV